MANRWCDGFGRYGGDTAKMLNGSSGQAWAQADHLTTGATTTGWHLSSANPRTGTHHLRQNEQGVASWARRVFGAPLTEVFFGHAVHFSELPIKELAPGTMVSLTNNGGICLASFRDQANAVQLSVWLGTDGSLVVYQGGFQSGSFFVGTLLARSIPIIGAGAYQHIEYYAKAGTADGAIEIRVDEVSRLNLTGIDTLYQASTEFSQVAMGSGGAEVLGTLGTGVWDVADCYVNDTVDDGSGASTWLGDVKSGCQLVNADTAQADFALSAGVLGYPLLGQAPPDDGTYIDTAATTARSDFGLEDTPANLSEIITVRPFVRAMKDDAGTATIAPNMLSGSSEGTVSDQPITTAFAYYDSNVPLDPATGAPWTKSGLDAAFEVVERVT